MLSKKSWRILLSQFCLGAVAVFSLVLVHGTSAGDQPVPLVTDWSHRHIVFSPPHNLIEQFRLSGNVRYVQQWVRRYSGGKGFGWRGHAFEPEPLQGDWNVFMGNVGTVGAGQYPAKFSFSTTTANCATAAQPDFVVYNTSLGGSAAANAAFDIGTFSAMANTGDQIKITNGSSTTLTMTAGTTNGTGTFNKGTSAATSASNFITAINMAANGPSIGLTNTASNPVAGEVQVTDATAGVAGNAFTVSYVPSGTSVFTWTFSNFTNGTSGVPTIVAFDNLYTGCAGTVPSTYWAYNTGTGDSVVTSPVLSGDGKQVAFMQAAGAGAASLVILRWSANNGSVAGPVAPTSDTPTNYYNSGTGCTAPCMTTIAFGDGDGDTTSSPFYDYAPGSDTLYVGDASGRTHKFHPVFAGIPAEVTTTWPVLTATAPLSSPVYDEGTGLVLISASFSTTNNGGRLHSICATTVCGTVGTTVATGILGPEITNGIATCQGTGPTLGDGANIFMDTPIIDPSNKTVYVVITNDGTNSAGLYEFPEAYTANACGTEIKIGTGSTTGATAYAGTFDNAYYSGGAGHFYICGNTGGDPTLYQVTVSAAGALSGTANASAALTTAATTCGPVVEVFNSPSDWIFTSVQASGQMATPVSCPTNTGCIMSFNVASGATLTTTTATVGHTAVAGGASGAIEDNTATSPSGTSQIYFTPLATGTCTTSTVTAYQGFGGCAIQASQSTIN